MGVPYDLQDLGLWLEDFNVNVDLVIHMAAPVGGREKIEGDPLYNADSLRLDSAMFRWAVKHAKTMVYPSSSAVYGTRFQDVDGIRLREEYLRFAYNEDIPVPDEMYGFTKLAGEMLAWKSAAYGLNTLCIRPFSGYGEGQSFEYPVPSIARRAINREDPLVVWGPGTQQRDFVHVRDLIGATMARLESGVFGYQTMNIGSGIPTSFNDIAKTCASIIGYEPQIQNLTDKPMGVATRYADIREMVQFYTPQITLHEGLGRVIDFIRSSEETADAQDDQDV
jgi:nucleoside-diphosphate-sugar epimerase